LQQRLREATGGEDEAEEDEDDDTDAAMKGLGNIGFLYKLAQVDPTEPADVADPPTTPLGFKAKMDRMVGKMRDLRIDLDKWEKDQEALPPDQRKAPPGVYCGTVHATKGAQWANCFVQMPKGKFPMEMRVRPGDPPPPPEEVQAQLESERRLAYVGLTRAARSLTVVCPSLVGGRPAGVSSFVLEAGLKLGENVEKPISKQASDEYAGLIPDDWATESQYGYGRV
jgi:superfamily I DNA/RNA helicase